MEKIGRTKIVDLLKRTDIGAMVNVKGWVRTRRGSKQVNFIALNDGSTINNLQVVVDLANFDEEMLKLITTGACISVNGEMVESVGSGQKVEVQAREIEVLGEKIIFIRDRTSLVFLQVIQVHRSHLEHLSGTFTIGSRNDRRMEIEESPVMEKLVDSNCHVMTNTEHRTKSIGTRTQMGNLAQEFHRVAFLL